MEQSPSEQSPSTPSTTGTPARRQEDELAFLVSELDHHMTPGKPLSRARGREKRGSASHERGVTHAFGAPFSNVGVARYGLAAFEPHGAAPHCALCPTEFSFFKRRHHCRACRRLVCDDCSNAKVRVGPKKGKKVRLCDRCVHVLKLPVKYDDEDVSLAAEDKGTLARGSRENDGGIGGGEGDAATVGPEQRKDNTEFEEDAPRTPSQHMDGAEMDTTPNAASTRDADDTAASSAQQLADALRRCAQLEQAERETAALAQNAILKLEEATRAHLEDKQRWLLSEAEIRKENSENREGAVVCGDAGALAAASAAAAQSAQQAESISVSLEQKLKEMQTDMSALTSQNDDLNGQVAAAREATAAAESQYHQEHIQLQIERDAQLKQDRDDLLAAERELGALQKKLSSALALASSTEEKRVALEVQFEKQRAEDAAQSSAAAERLVAEAVQQEKDVARKSIVEVRTKMRADERVHLEALAAKLDREHSAAIRSKEAEASEELSAALAEAEKKRKDALAAAQHGHQVRFHILYLSGHPFVVVACCCCCRRYSDVAAGNSPCFNCLPPLRLSLPLL